MPGNQVTRQPQFLAPYWLSVQAHRLLCAFASEETAMSLVRLLGFRTLNCGCVIGRYRELATSREVSYVEEKGGACEAHGHRRNHTIHEPAPAAVSLITRAS